MIKAVLFDLDGVLVDMPDAHYEALNQALTLFGTKINQDEHLNFFNGLPTRQKLLELEKQERLPLGLSQFINTIKQKYTKELIPKYCPPDYAKIMLLKVLKEKNLKLACCSNSVRETLDIMLCAAGLSDFFDFVIGNNEVQKPKPDPEMYLTSFAKLNLQPAECLIIEDAPHGIAAAEASGAQVIKVRGVQDVTLSLVQDFIV